MALAVVAKFAAFRTSTELHIVRVLNRKTNRGAINQSLIMLLMQRNVQPCFRVAL